MMTTDQRIEANANLILWCVHILGMDDVHATTSHLEAVLQAQEHNNGFFSRPDLKADDILSFAYAAPWPHSKTSHADALAKQPI